MKLDYKLNELSAIVGKTMALMSLKVNGKVPWMVDEIKALYDALGDEAWDIYEISQFNRMTYLRNKSNKTKGGK